MTCKIIRTPYLPEELAFIKEHRHLLRKELTARFNQKFNSKRTEMAISALCKRYGWLFKGQHHASFKEGHIPSNTKPVGYEYITQKGYVQIKVAEKTWRHKHRWVWENAHGKIPNGYCITFINGNTSDCRLENLALISAREVIYINTLGFADVTHDIKTAAIGLVRLKLKVFDLSKDRKKPTGSRTRRYGGR